MSTRITQEERDVALRLFTMTEQIVQGARATKQRTGQYLFNHLPAPAATVFTGTIYDTFHKDLSSDEIRKWIDEHLIFQGTEIVGCFAKNNIWWEKT